MLTIFNRKELTTTFSMEERSRIEDILDVNGIFYWTKAVSRSGGLGGSRSRVGTMGQDMGMEYQYKIYVYREDYEKAKAWLRG